MRVLKRNKPCIYPICCRAHPATYTMGPILVRPVCWPILSLATLPRYFARTAISQSKRRPLARTHAPSSPGSPPPKCDLLGNDDGRVLFPHANTDAHPASVLCPGAWSPPGDWGHIGKYRARRRLPSNPSVPPCCWSFLLEGSHAPWIAGPELSGWLGEILTNSRCLGAARVRTHQ